MRIKKYIILVAFFCCVVAVGISQQVITVKDKETGENVAFVNYQTNHQSGVADANGQIHLSELQHRFLKITHVGFTEILLEKEALSDALEKKQIWLQPLAVPLSAVSVYGISGRNAKAAITLGNPDFIQHDAGQVLQQIAGFSALRKSGAFGTDPVFRGFKLDQLAILSDGAMATTTACPNRMDPPASQVLISQVQQIDVIKGPYSFRFGPASGAVINFITPDASFSNTTRWFGRLNTGVETNGEIYRAEAQLGVQSKKLQVTSNAAYALGHSYLDGNDSVIPARFRRASFGATADWQVTSKQLLKLTANKNVARNIDFPTTMMDLLTDDTWMLQATHKYKPVSAWLTEWTTRVYVSTVDHLMGNANRPAAKNMEAATAAVTKNAGGRSELKMKINQSVWYAGMDARQETIDGDRTRNMLSGPMAGKRLVDTVWQQPVQSRVGLFGEWQQQMRSVQFRASARVDVVQANAKQLAGKFGKLRATTEATDVNPSISMGISKKLSKYWWGGIWLGRGVRSASISERYTNFLAIGKDPYEMLGNPTLKPEANLQTDWQLVFKNNKGTVAQLNAFYSSVRHYISSVINPALKPVYGGPGVREFVNLNRATLYGFEASWDQQWNSWLKQQTTLAYAQGTNEDTGQPLAEMAPLDFRVRVMGLLWKQKLQPFLQVRCVASQQRIATDFGEKETPSFSVLDFGASLQLLPKFHTTFVINNLGDVAYREHLNRFIRPTLGLNAPGRSFALNFSYTF